ncbi:hypothetical protein SUGI_0188240 [Cryptomeria japonica]|uniref:mitogen-activated protein kinase kinase 9-like n=1 Tax=Cryptomeria japonica TaxID=3369 RepID=UPI002408B1FD|nr:mitogen-activated protein kinase kinase 9-like [Cryptomeria japonica]GLJ12298.1 hypothetical protein SUGI_0188240 [Cryptomeria japonica]
MAVTMNMATRKRLELKLPVPIHRRDNIALPLPLPPPPQTDLKQSIKGLCDLERVGVLGYGSQGRVYKVLHRRSCSYYALKVVCLDCEPSARQIIREMEIVKEINSPTIVKCEGVFEEGGNINFVLEYMDGGSLANLLKRKRRMTESSIAKVARQVLEGLKYLHGRRIVHRDLKPSNLLIHRSSQAVKIADFGVSRSVSESIDVRCSSYVGTCAYMSPERFDPESYGGSYNGYAADMWSLGLTFLECYVGYFPFVGPGEHPDWATLMCAICFGEPPSAPSSASAEFQNFIACCLQKNPKKRWTASQLLTHPFLKTILQ